MGQWSDFFWAWLLVTKNESSGILTRLGKLQHLRERVRMLLETVDAEIEKIATVNRVNE